jgi:hypothetical protein
MTYSKETNEIVVKAMWDSPEVLYRNIFSLYNCYGESFEKLVKEKLIIDISFFRCIHCRILYRRHTRTVKETNKSVTVESVGINYVELAESGGHIGSRECEKCIERIERERVELEHEIKQIDAMIKLGVIKENGLYTSTKIIYFCEAICMVCVLVFALIYTAHLKENVMFVVLSFIGCLAFFMLIPLGLIQQKDFNKHYNWRSNYRKYKKQQQQTKGKQNE